MKKYEVLLLENSIILICTSNTLDKDSSYKIYEFKKEILSNIKKIKESRKKIIKDIFGETYIEDIQ